MNSPMKIRILTIGQKMPTWVLTGFEDYFKRIQPFVQTQIVELPMAKRGKNDSAADILKYRQIEGDSILNAMKTNEVLIALEVGGKEFSTEKLAETMKGWMLEGNDVVLAIGGPDGHSDADVLIHALMDAMLGAAGLRDIGYYFPPEDDQYKGISSVLLLEKVNSLLKEQGLQAYNIDVMVIAEAPKLKPHIEEMKANLQRVLEIPLDRISIKATTNEMLGALGRREGIAAQAVVTLYEGEV